MIAAVLFFLIGLALVVGGYSSLMVLYMTGVSLIVAGILVIILAIVMAMKKEMGMKAPAK